MTVAPQSGDNLIEHWAASCDRAEGKALGAKDEREGFLKDALGPPWDAPEVHNIPSAPSLPKSLTWRYITRQESSCLLRARISYVLTGSHEPIKKHSPRARRRGVTSVSYQPYVRAGRTVIPPRDTP